MQLDDNKMVNATLLPFFDGDNKSPLT